MFVFQTMQFVIKINCILNCIIIKNKEMYS